MNDTFTELTEKSASIDPVHEIIWYVFKLPN